MNHSLPTLWTAMALLAASPAMSQQARDIRYVGPFEFDLTALGDPPPPQLPSNPLAPQDFTLDSIIGRLLQLQEDFELMEIVAGREFYESPDWFLERDEEGSILALRKPVEVEAQPLNEEMLRQASLQRLAMFGIGPDEVSRVLQRQLMRQDEIEGELEPPVIHRFKTFVMRGLNGIEVEGHRAVVTYHLDGSFHRVWLKWPPLALDGHKLQTDATESDIIELAFITLIQEGETSGKVRLRWKYVPTLLESGEVRLRLMVGARFRRAEDGPLSTEPREFDVTVDVY